MLIKNTKWSQTYSDITIPAVDAAGDPKLHTSIVELYKKDDQSADDLMETMKECPCLTALIVIRDDMSSREEEKQVLGYFHQVFKFRGEIFATSSDEGKDNKTFRINTGLFKHGASTKEQQTSTVEDLLQL